MDGKWIEFDERYGEGGWRQINEWLLAYCQVTGCLDGREVVILPTQLMALIKATKGVY